MIRRWRWWLLLFLAVVGLALGFHFYLSSHFFVARVAAKLENLYGGKVHLGNAVIDTQHTILFDVQFYEEDESYPPWLTIDRLDADLSLQDAIAGNAPSSVTLDGLTITLRFDAEGRLLTDLPKRRDNSPSLMKQLPELALIGGKLRLLGTAGRHLDFDEMELTLKPSPGQGTFAGHGRGVNGTEWYANGVVDLTNSQVAFSAHSKADVTVTQPMLEMIPLVSRGTWDEVNVGGVTPVDLALSYDWSIPRRHFQIELQPRKANVYVAAIDLAASDVSGKVVIADGKVKLDNLHGESCGGTLAVDGLLNFVNPEPVIALTKIQVDDADVRKLPASWSLPKQIDGKLHADFNLHVATENGKLRSRGSGTGEIRDAQFGGNAMAGPVQLSLQTPRDATLLAVDLRLPATDLAVVGATFDAHLPVGTSGQLALDLKLYVPLDTISEPQTYQAKGEIDLQRGVIAGLELEPFMAAVHYENGKLKFDVEDAKLKTGGKVKAIALVDLKAPLAFSAHLEPTALDLKSLQKLEESLRPTQQISGQLDAVADLHGTLRPVAVATSGKANCRDVRSGSWVLQTAEFKWSSDAEFVHIDSFEADAFGGSIRGKADLPLDSARAGGGQLRFYDLELARLIGLGSDSIAGTVDATLNFVARSSEFLSTGKGKLVVSNLAWKDDLLAGEMRGDIFVNSQELTIGNLAGTAARGNFNGKLVVNLKQSERSWFQFELNSAELNELLRPWPQLAEHAQGTTDIRMRGTLGNDWAGSANVVLQRGKLLGLEVTEWRAPLRWSYRPAEGRGEIELTDSHAQIAQGRATTQASLAWASDLRFTSQIQFSGINLQQAFPGTKIGNGRATGRIDLKSDRLQSLDDLQGSLTATMQHTQALEYPVLKQVAPIIGMSSTKTFQSGEVRARLAKSVVRVEKLALAEGPWQLYAEGSMTLQGNVQLEMTANSGKLGNVAAALGWRVPQTGTIAGEMLTRATTALSPQLIHVHVRGTVRDPRIQVVPLPLLTEQALRFFAGM